MNRDRLQTCSLIIAGILLCCLMAVYSIYYKPPVQLYLAEAERVNEEVIEEQINLNTATENKLMAVEGIGSVTAKRIIEYRRENGEFKFVEELADIKGIGTAKYEKIRKYFCVK